MVGVGSLKKSFVSNSISGGFSVDVVVVKWWSGSTICIPPVPISMQPTWKLINLNVIKFMVILAQPCNVLYSCCAILCICIHPVNAMAGQMGTQKGGIFQAENVFVYKTLSFKRTLACISHEFENIVQSAHTMFKKRKRNMLLVI